MSLLVSATSLLQATTYSGQRWTSWWLWVIIAAILFVLLFAFRRSPPRRPPTR